MTSASSDRPALRRRLIAAREALQPAQRSLLDAALAEHLADLLGRLQVQTIGFCWPFRAEPDLVEFLVRWLTLLPGRRLGLPVVPDTPGPLRFLAWQPGDVLVADKFGIPAPQGTPELVPEVVLVPVNGFDARGYRIGYGGGYFDRTLVALTPAPVSIGVGYELARCEDVRPEPHDLPLDWIVTEAGIAVAKT